MDFNKDNSIQKEQDYGDENENIYSDEHLSKFLKQIQENLLEFSISSDDVEPDYFNNQQIITTDNEKVINDLKTDVHSSEKELVLEFSDSESSSDEDFEKFLTSLKETEEKPEYIVKSTSDDCKQQIEVHSNKEKVSASSELKKIEDEAAKNFTTYRQKYSQILYTYFNEKIFNKKLPADMSVMWNPLLTSTAGITKCKRGGICSIELSSDLLTSFNRLRDTLLHEMCHAACWVIHRSNCCHGPLWCTWAARCNLILPELEVPKRCHNYEIKFHYILECVSCDWKRKRLKMCPKLQRTVCPVCKSTTKLSQI